MIKLVTFLKRSTGLTRRGFAERWLTIHAPLAAVFPGLRGYMLGFSLEDGEPPADGIAQLWFDSRLAAQASYASDIGRSGSADANAYLSRRQHLLASEIWRADTASLAAMPFKVVIAAKRTARQARADFVRWWTDALPDIGARCNCSQIRISVDEAGQLLNSGTAGSLDLIQGEAVFDGMMELFFISEDAARAALDRFRAEGRPQLLSQASSVEDTLLCEHVIVRPAAPAFGRHPELV